MNEQYVLQDRFTANKWAVKVSSGEIKLVTTTDSIQAEPVMRDATTGLYYIMFISDGELAIEETTIVLDNPVIIEDDTTDVVWRFYIVDGQLLYSAVAVPAQAITFLFKSRIYNTIFGESVMENPNIIRALMEQELEILSEMDKCLLLENEIKRTLFKESGIITGE